MNINSQLLVRHICTHIKIHWNRIKSHVLEISIL